jgi:hypothetical protein
MEKYEESIKSYIEYTDIIMQDVLNISDPEYYSDSTINCFKPFFSKNETITILGNNISKIKSNIYGLNKLPFHSKEITDNKCLLLCKHFNDTMISEIDFSNNKLTDISVKPILNLLKNNKYIKNIELKGNKISEKQLNIIKNKLSENQYKQIFDNFYL